MSAIEFLRAEVNNNEASAMKEEVINLVAKGYKNVPDWVRLSRLTKAKILEKGYTTQDINAVAEEAALGDGMRK
jgi:histone acetyltransferase (RNA polymerase elongator complex component)